MQPERRSSVRLPASVLAVLLITAPDVGRAAPSASDRPTGIALFECVTAGDYRWTTLDHGGEIDFRRAGSDYRVFERRSGALAAERTAEILELMAAVDRGQRSGFHDISRSEDIVVEDRYVTVIVTEGAVAWAVTAHEAVAPEAVGRLIAMIERTAAEQEAAPEDADAVLIALPPELLPCLGVDLPAFDAGASALKEDSDLLPGLGRQIPIPASRLEALKRRLFPSSHAIRVRTRTEELVLVLLE